MKVGASVKKICRHCKIIKRGGVVRVICDDPKHCMSCIICDCSFLLCTSRPPRILTGFAEAIFYNF